MTPSETVMLTRYVKACCPQQVMDEYTPDAWHDLLGDLEFADCRAAVVEVAKQKPFVAPAEIRAEVKRIRRDRLARAIIPAPDAGDAEEAGRYKTVLDAHIKRIADGQRLHLAISGPVREGEPPEAWTRARAARGGALAPRKLLTKQELAQIQAAESRAERAQRGDTPADDDKTEAS